MVRLTDAEWQLMNALWQGHPATAREIEARLPEETKWAYTTIKTMLSRLARKGALREQKRGNVSFYEPALSRRRARAAALRSLAQSAFGGAVGPLIHFLLEEEKLSPAERQKLTLLLQEKREKEDKR